MTVSAAGLMRSAARRTKRSWLLFRERHLINYAFVHINKTGGTSVGTALHLIPGDHRTALQRREEMGLREWDSRFTFAIVRNPWDRVLSHYAFRLSNGIGRLGKDPIDFNSWVLRAYGERDPLFSKDSPKFHPQLEWIVDERGERIVDFVGRFETLEEDFLTICRHIGCTAGLPHLNRSDRGRYRDCYDDRSIEIVADRFAPDIAEFGYEY